MHQSAVFLGMFLFKKWHPFCSHLHRCHQAIAFDLRFFGLLALRGPTLGLRLGWVPSRAFQEEIWGTY
jgi:hypothetical protein